MRRSTLLAPLVLSLALVGCGEAKPTEVDQAQIDHAVQQALEQADRERDPEAAPEATPTPTPTPTRKAPKSNPSTRAALTACDANIRVRAGSTTCPFAQNVFLAYWMNDDSPGVFADSPGLPAYSTAAGKTFNVQCHGTETITCRTGTGGLVKFPISAVSAYSFEQAARYADSHDTGGVRPSQDPAPNRSPSDEEPNQPAPDAGAYDDVANCSDTTDTDFPTPEGDPNGLDRDGDGIACES